MSKIDRTRRGKREKTGLLGTKYTGFLDNTFDYWEVDEDPSIGEAQVRRAVTDASCTEDTSVQVYVHVPFCLQGCLFCAFRSPDRAKIQEIERYSRLVTRQLRDMFEQMPARGKHVRSVNIGGGSPDLLGKHMDHVLRGIRNLPGVDDSTELSTECNLEGLTPDFVNILAHHSVTKVSVGVQSTDPTIRATMRQPRSLGNLDEALSRLKGRVPMVNVDLLTGLPGQTLKSTITDLAEVSANPLISAISSYILSVHCSPPLCAKLSSGKLRPQAPLVEQAQMRLHFYTKMIETGWIRKGSSTYFNAERIPGEAFEKIAGNEAIGVSRYEDYLIAAGPGAIGYMPGVRCENSMRLEPWCEAVDNGRLPFNFPKCSTDHRRDLGLTVFPLRPEGLARRDYESLVESGALSKGQQEAFHELIDEGFIVAGDEKYDLSVMGEVFMGNVVHDLKKPRDKRVVEKQIDQAFHRDSGPRKKQPSDGEDLAADFT
jgi:coproporphyrinogen III oxidase-like Fe-S oxidoreductase